jgi:hypothetical protein
MRAALLSTALLCACAPPATSPDDDDPADGPRRCNGSVALCDRPFDQVTLPSTHNSMSNADAGWLIPNQQHGLQQQLDDGVRGFLLDTHAWQGGLYLCHVDCTWGSLPLLDGLGILAGFLETHPDEVLAIIFQDAISGEETEGAFEDAGLLPSVYTHAGGAWPTLGELIDAGTRVVVGAEFGGPPPAWYHHAWDLWFDTPYTFHDVEAFNCDLNRGDPANPLFLVNHWISDPASTPSNAEVANAADVLLPRAQACAAAWEHPVNLLAVDHYAVGDLFSVVEELNR